jgi:hypothetical protein
MAPRGRTFIVALLALGILPGTAGAATLGHSLKLAAGDVQGFTSDGERYVAFQQGSRVTALDTRTGHRYTTATPAGCSMNLGAAAHNLSFPELLVGCTTGTGRAGLLDVRTGSLDALPPGQTWDSVGRYWVEGQQAVPCPSTAASCEPFYQWHTHATRYVSVAQLHPGGGPSPTPAGAGLVAPQYIDPDLDSSGLEIAPPCSPYETQSLDNAIASYAPPYVLLSTTTLPTPAQVAAGDFGNRGLELGRCGSQKTITLARRAVDPVLSAGNVSWANGTAAYDYDTAVTRTYRWAVPGAEARFSMPVTALHTRYEALLARTTRQACDKLCTSVDVDLYVAGLAH